jgi:prepilin-type N-terminal cleavage/methylation domain-containing protein/prepilin-type processing-associated H-X9-DG protein
MMKTQKAFTLIELLVVVAIIAVLVAILLPSIVQARKQARSVICLNNLRYLGMGLGFYRDDYRDYFPIVTNGHGADGWLGRLAPYIGLSGVEVVPPFYHLNVTAENYRKLKGTILDCPEVPGPSLNTSSASTDNWWQFNYTMNTTPHIILAREKVGEPACWSVYLDYPLRGTSIRNPQETVAFGEGNAGWGPPQPIAYYTQSPYRFFAWWNSAAWIDWTRHGQACNWLFFDSHVEPMSESDFWAPSYYVGHGWAE